MDAIQAARELGKAIQRDKRYHRISEAQQNSDADQELQKDIEEFNEMRGRLNTEVQKKEKDSDKIKEMDAELKTKYNRIYANQNMREYNAARNEFQELLTFINQIVNGSANGENPDTIEFQAACGGDCGGCAGCS